MRFVIVEMLLRSAKDVAHIFSPHDVTLGCLISNEDLQCREKR